jgi:hypothetical protein
VVRASPFIARESRGGRGLQVKDDYGMFLAKAFVEGFVFLSLRMSERHYSMATRPCCFIVTYLLCLRVIVNHKIEGSHEPPPPF